MAMIHRKLDALIVQCGERIAMVVDRERWIVDYIRQHENTTQRALLEAAEEARVGSDRTVRGYLARLDGKLIKRAREAREVRLQSIEYWRRHEHQSFDLRVPHTVKLKTVLDLFRSQIPFVQEHALQAAYGLEYRPDLKLEFEGHLLFPDLLFHLGLLQLRADPSVAWSEFKKQASRFLAARDALWGRCIKAASDALGLPLDRTWRGEGLSENCVAFLYTHALAATRGETEKENPFQDSKVVPVGDTMEYWIGGRGILRRRPKGPTEPEDVRDDVTKRLKRAFKLTERPEFLRLADPVVDSMNQLRAIREGLASALEEASYYEVFPGACRFTGTA